MHIPPRMHERILCRSTLRGVVKYGVYGFVLTIITTVAAVAIYQFTDYWDSPHLTIPSEHLDTEQVVWQWRYAGATQVHAYLAYQPTHDILENQFSELLDQWWAVDPDKSKARYGPGWEQLANRPAELIACEDRISSMRGSIIFLMMFKNGVKGSNPYITSTSIFDTPYWHHTDLGYDPVNKICWGYQATNAFGWPFRTMKSQLRMAPIAEHAPFCATEVRFAEPMSDTEELWELSHDQYGSYNSAASWRAVPLCPIWPGLLLNTAIWGAAVFIVGRLLKVILGRWRAQRGRCPNCGYILHKTDSCPECGRGC